MPEATARRPVRKHRQGRVVSDAMDKTVVVLIESRKRHPTYGKMVKHFKKLYVHDEQNEAKVGDLIRVVETRPLSRLKRWRLAEIVERGKAVGETAEASE